MITQPERFYRLLLEKGLLDEVQLAAAKEYPDGIGKYLERAGILDEREYIAFLVKECGYHYLNPLQVEIDLDAAREIPVEISRQWLVLGVRKLKSTLAVAMPDPFAVHALENLREATVLKILPLVSRREDIQMALERVWGDVVQQEVASPGTEVLQQGIPLVERFTFDSFVVGKGNEFPYAMATAVAKAPGESYNPLFLYSDVGLGKTHLLNAIGNYIKRSNLPGKLVYTTCEYFNSRVVEAIKENQIDSFREAYQNVVVLLIDDVEFLSGRDRTQEEFFHLFNSMIQAGRQVVVTSDRPPSELTVLEKRLRSRFMGGTVANIEPPDMETRLAILNKKKGNLEVEVPSEVLQLFAERITGSIRELEGALNTIVSLYRFGQEAISLKTAEKVLREMGY